MATKLPSKEDKAFHEKVKKDYKDKKISNEQRNKILQEKAQENAKKRDINDLLPSQMTREEMEKYLTQNKVTFDKKADNITLRTLIRETMDAGAKEGPKL